MNRTRSCFLVTIACVALLSAACKSEVDDKSAASVSEPAPSASTAPPSPPAGVPAAVIAASSRIEFVGAKVTRDHKGGFREFSGSVFWVDGKASSLLFEIDMSSIFTDTEKLTGHLKTPDFFDVATYPKTTFSSTSIAEMPSGDSSGATHTISGILTMHGVDKAISFPVTVTSDATGVGATAEFTINRQDWGISYRGAADDLIKDEVLIRLDMKFPPPPSPPVAPVPAG